MPRYNLIQYSVNYSKTSGSSQQYCKDKPVVNNNSAIIDFNTATVTDSFNFKEKIDDGTKDVEMMIPLKYLSNFWTTLEMHLIDFEINLILTWSPNFVIVSTDVTNQGATFSITDTKLYVPVVTLSTQDNVKLSDQF